ncbi:GNAT family N-acetyltransferase [Dysgonomonas sp. Marseille-P4677]|uniref:GNAT family N-acetyltransferase n=1 Tax=Dysgonomonas sp. Marseille-P4677 TaxID=2364790 RepID=UPI0019121649|nr:GNAT family N-acetyltransferase [Dysgonomonas sp. Marseille-P4677]MBK5721705.1 GNAT family N-acetyltransferase [Dysgonomonas sp. Marseille-P4677]
MNYKISVASTKDLETILYIQKKAFAEVAKLMNKYDLPPLLQTIEELQDEAENNTILKCFFEEKIVGSVRGFLDDENICHVGKLIVDPDFQNKGIGKALMYEIERHFAFCKKFVLFTGDETPNTLHLYRKVGYHIIGKQYMGNINMLLMEKENKL